MNAAKEKWKEEVINSMKGSRRAVPPPDLLARIEANIDASQARVFPIRRWSYVVAAALLLILLNVFAMRQMMLTNTSSGIEQVAGNDAEQILISNFNLYE